MNPLRRAYGVYFLGIELFLAIAIAAVFSYIHASTHFGPHIDTLLNGNRQAIYATLASVFGALLGFVITALSIVLGYASDERMKRIRQSKHYATLWKIFISSTRWLALVTVVTITALVFDRDAHPRPWFLYVTVATTCIAIARVARVVWVIEQLVWMLVSRTAIAEKSQEPKHEGDGETIANVPAIQPPPARP